MEAHEIRVGHHRKIRSYVETALDFLEKNPDRPLVLHTLPPKDQGKRVEGTKPEEENTDSSANRGRASDAAFKEKGKKGLPTSVDSVPRLISVVEIIKREFMKKLDQTQADLIGLHQYNEVGILESNDNPDKHALEVTNVEEDRAAAIALALQGNNHLKQVRRPFMKVTLCRTEIPELENKGATYQQPSRKRLSKSANARRAKRRRKEKGVAEETEEGV